MNYPYVSAGSAIVAVLAAVASSSLGAQAFNYPSFQPPRVVEREFNFALADDEVTTINVATMAARTATCR